MLIHDFVLEVRSTSKSSKKKKSGRKPGLGEDLDDLVGEEGSEIEALAHILEELGFEVTDMRDNEIDVSTEFGDLTFKIEEDIGAYGIYRFGKPNHARFQHAFYCCRSCNYNLS